MKKSPVQTTVSKLYSLSPLRDIEVDTEPTVDKEAISKVESYYDKLLKSEKTKERARSMYGGRDAQSILDARINRLRTAKYKNVSQEDWDAVMEKVTEQIAYAKETGIWTQIA